MKALVRIILVFALQLTVSLTAYADAPAAVHINQVDGDVAIHATYAPTNAAENGYHAEMSVTINSKPLGYDLFSDAWGPSQSRLNVFPKPDSVKLVRLKGQSEPLIVIETTSCGGSCSHDVRVYAFSKDAK